MTETVHDAAAALDYVRDLIRFGIGNSAAVCSDEGRSNDWLSGYRMALEGLAHSLPTIAPVEEAASLELRLAGCLAEAIDTPLLKGRDEVGSFASPLELRLGFFAPDVANRAAELLEEAGR